MSIMQAQCVGGPLDGEMRKKPKGRDDNAMAHSYGKRTPSGMRTAIYIYSRKEGKWKFHSEMWATINQDIIDYMESIT